MKKLLIQKISSLHLFMTSLGFSQGQIQVYFLTHVFGSCYKTDKQGSHQSLSCSKSANERLCEKIADIKTNDQIQQILGIVDQQCIRLSRISQEDQTNVQPSNKQMKSEQSQRGRKEKRQRKRKDKKNNQKGCKRIKKNQNNSKGQNQKNIFMNMGEEKKIQDLASFIFGNRAAQGLKDISNRNEGIFSINLSSNPFVSCKPVCPENPFKQSNSLEDEEDQDNITFSKAPKSSSSFANLLLSELASMENGVRTMRNGLFEVIM